jgi:hypothetical protein
LCSGIFVGVKRISSEIPPIVQTDYIPASEQGRDLTVTYQDASPPGIRIVRDRVASVAVIEVSTLSLPENGVLYITVKDRDRNQDPYMKEYVQVICTTGKIPGNWDSKSVLLTEVSSDSNTFTGEWDIICCIFDSSSLPNSSSC